MASGGVNKVMLIGNLGRDPEIRYTQGGTAVVNLSLATTRRYRDRDGQNQEQTDWHRVVMFARLAEIAGEYLRKGQQIYIEGRLQTRQWQDNQGQTRYTTEVVANDMQMLGGGRGGGGGGGWDQDTGSSTGLDQTPAAGDDNQADFDQDFEDDIPF